VANIKKAPFREVPWLHEIKPCDIAPLIFKASKRKKWCAMQAMINDAWIGNNTLDEDFTMDQPSAT
jgi:hypothetical protein